MCREHGDAEDEDEQHDASALSTMLDSDDEAAGAGFAPRSQAAIVRDTGAFLLVLPL